MARRNVLPRPALIVLAAVVLALVLRSEAQDDTPRVEVCRHRAADGWGADRIDLARLVEERRTVEGRLSKAFAREAARVEEAKTKGHHTGLPACRARRQRTVQLPQEVPPQFRRGTFYFVRVPRNGQPSILPAALPEEAEVFVVDAQTLQDVTALSRAVGRRVNLAGAELARAFGVDCANARVEPSVDGRSATVYEEAP